MMIRVVPVRFLILFGLCIRYITAQECPSTIELRKEGDSVPSVSFQTRVRTADGNFDWKVMTSDDFFRNKRVVLFSLPGAFTPTCSSSHLPGYEGSYDDMKTLGIDEVYCLSVNDAFVMRQWGLHLGLKEDKTPGSLGFQGVKLIPDGAALFTRGMGMSCVWDMERGFGERSWRYSAVIDDGIIEKLFIEGSGVVHNSGPDPFEVSNAATMLHYLRTATAPNNNNNNKSRSTEL